MRICAKRRSVDLWYETISTVMAIPFYRNRFFIPAIGIFKCRNREKAIIWWPDLSADVGHYVENCKTCVKNGKAEHQPMEFLELSEGPREEIGSGGFIFCGQFFLLVVDYYS